ncbi:MAG: hypothetical protein OWV35_10300 [Firmicutes bacterium]|nr:hypothetical protein [Bacillota bacterium]
MAQLAEAAPVVSQTVGRLLALNQERLPLLQRVGSADGPSAPDPAAMATA